MKTIRLHLILACLLAFSSIPAFSQRFEPTENWPFLHRDFSEGNIRFTDGSFVTYDHLNVSVINGSLLFVDEKTGQIMVAESPGILAAKVGPDTYLNVRGWMMKVVAESDSSTVLLKTEVDLDEYGKTDIGYGIASGSATSRKVTASSLEGLASTAVSMHATLRSQLQEGGKALPLEESCYLRIGSKFVCANKKDVLDFAGIGRTETGAFIKSRKIKWKKPQSLLELADFLATRIK